MLVAVDPPLVLVLQLPSCSAALGLARKGAFSSEDRTTLHEILIDIGTRHCVIVALCLEQCPRDDCYKYRVGVIVFDVDTSNYARAT